MEERKIDKCRWCEETIEEFAGSIWASKEAEERLEDAVVCSYDGERTHEPTPDEIPCEGCGRDIPFRGNRDEDQWCERCIAEAEQEERDRNWDYYHA